MRGPATNELTSTPASRPPVGADISRPAAARSSWSAARTALYGLALPSVTLLFLLSALVQIIDFNAGAASALMVVALATAGAFAWLVRRSDNQDARRAAMIGGVLGLPVGAVFAASVSVFYIPLFGPILVASIVYVILGVAAASTLIGAVAGRTRAKRGAPMVSVGAGALVTASLALTAGWILMTLEQQVETAREMPLPLLPALAAAGAAARRLRRRPP